MPTLLPLHRKMFTAFRSHFSVIAGNSMEEPLLDQEHGSVLPVHACYPRSRASDSAKTR